MKKKTKKTLLKSAQSHPCLVPPPPGQILFLDFVTAETCSNSDKTSPSVFKSCISPPRESIKSFIIINQIIVRTRQILNEFIVQVAHSNLLKAFDFELIQYFKYSVITYNSFDITELVFQLNPS